MHKLYIYIYSRFLCKISHSAISLEIRMQSHEGKHIWLKVVHAVQECLCFAKLRVISWLLVEILWFAFLSLSCLCFLGNSPSRTCSTLHMPPATAATSSGRVSAIFLALILRVCCRNRNASIFLGRVHTENIVMGMRDSEFSAPACMRSIVISSGMCLFWKCFSRLILLWDYHACTQHHTKLLTISPHKTRSEIHAYQPSAACSE